MRIIGFPQFLTFSPDFLLKSQNSDFFPELFFSTYSDFFSQILKCVPEIFSAKKERIFFHSNSDCFSQISDFSHRISGKTSELFFRLKGKKNYLDFFCLYFRGESENIFFPDF